MFVLEDVEELIGVENYLDFYIKSSKKRIMLTSQNIFIFLREFEEPSFSFVV